MASNIDRLIAALGLDAEGEIALRRLKDENNIRDNDPDVLAALAIAGVDQTLRKMRADEITIGTAIMHQTQVIAELKNVITAMTQQQAEMTRALGALTALAAEDPDTVKKD